MKVFGLNLNPGSLCVEYACFSQAHKLAEFSSIVMHNIIVFIIELFINLF